MRRLLFLVLLVSCSTDPSPGIDAGGGADAFSTCVDDGERCDADGDGCTRDVCESGVCVEGPLRGCDDGDSCTIDQCESTGPMTFECTNEASARSCTIDGSCYADGTPNPDNGCEVCDVTASESDWSMSTASCDDEDMCTTNDRCVAGACQGEAPTDAYEDNDSSADAAELEATTDSTDYPQGSLEAQLFPEDDVDFYTFVDSDTFRGLIYPKVELQGIPEGSDYDLCAFIACANGDEGAEATCESGSAARFEGMSGCCSDSAGDSDEEVRIGPDCSGGDDSVDVLVRVRRVAGAPVCAAPYTLIYGDD